MRKLITYFITFLLIVSSVHAIDIIFHDFHNQPIRNTGAWIIDQDTKTFHYVNSSCPITKNKNLVIILDQHHTPGKDYAAIFDSSNLINGSIVRVYPVGTVQGMVVDKLGNVIPYADIAFACVGFPVIKQTLKTDQFGYFSAELPVGNCRINTITETKTGFADLVIEHGNLHDINIQLNLTQSTLPIERDLKNFGIGAVIATIIFLIIAGIIIIKSQKKKPTHIPTAKNHTIPKLSKRSADLLHTLNAREKQIMHALLEKGELSQNQIQYATGIPKASLSRLIQKLFTCNFIDVEEYGKTKKTRLSSWFLKDDTSETK
jgi:uncharacterized membrane protein